MGQILIGSFRCTSKVAARSGAGVVVTLASSGIERGGSTVLRLPEEEARSIEPGKFFDVILADSNPVGNGRKKS